MSASLKLAGLWHRTEQFVTSVPVPKELLIQNPRLGILHKTMMLGTIALSLSNMWYNNLWYRNFQAEATALEFWAQAPENDTSVPAYCEGRNMAEYTFDYDENFRYEPTACVSLPPGENFKKSGSRMKFATYSNDRFTWTANGEDCTQEEIDCNARGGTLQRQAGRCTCSLVEEFIAMNVEQYEFFLNHGYKVDMDAFGLSYQTQRSTEDHGWQYNRGEGRTRLDTGIMTVVRSHQDGTICSIAGRRYWLAETLHGTLEEWLSCGGLSLDDRAEVLRGSLSGPEGPPARISGVNLELHLVYSNYRDDNTHDSIQDIDFDGVVCNLIVKAVPVWNSYTELVYMKLGPAFSGRSQQAATAYRYRYAQGVTINMEVSGMFGFLDWPLMFTATMSSLVLLSIPRKIAGFIGLYCVGATSKVYRQAQSSRFSIHDSFHGFCTRILSHAETFRVLCADTDKDHKGDPCVSRRDLEKYMIRALGHRFQGRLAHLQKTDRSGADDIGEVPWDDVAAILSCVTDNHEKVTIEEFIHAASSDEIIHIDDAVSFFDPKRKRSCLERLFETSEMVEFRQLSQSRIEKAARPNVDAQKESIGACAVSAELVADCKAPSLEDRALDAALATVADVRNEVKQAFADALAEGPFLKEAIAAALQQGMMIAAPESFVARPGEPFSQVLTAPARQADGTRPAAIPPLRIRAPLRADEGLDIAGRDESGFTLSSKQAPRGSKKRQSLPSPAAEDTEERREAEVSPDASVTRSGPGSPGVRNKIPTAFSPRSTESPRLRAAIPLRSGDAKLSSPRPRELGLHSFQSQSQCLAAIDADLQHRQRERLRVAAREALVALDTSMQSVPRSSLPDSVAVAKLGPQRLEEFQL